MTEEMGKPIKEARGEVNKAAWAAEYYADNAEMHLAAEDIASDATHSFVQYLPLGPVLGILPWNAPFWLTFRFCAPALMAGNTCLIKHDVHTPGSAEAIVAIFRKAGAPAGLIDALYIDNQATAGVIQDERIQAVSFTGSSAGGAKVASLAGSETKPTVLELGGSDPSIVLADADIDEAAGILTISRIINAGQSCIAAKRILVEEAVYDRFVAAFKDRLAALKLGDPRNEDTDVGPIARRDLLENLIRQVDASKQQGATCGLGGAPIAGDGFFYPVAVLTDVDPAMTCMSEETFGPVAVVMKVGDVEEAIRVANDTPYGLAASIWSTPERGAALVHRIEAGQVVVNGIVKTDPRLPSGGIKRSGYGRELGPHGIREFVNAQQVWIGPKRE
jgi:succinate-semialdehyde dehydrogenase/glutarate-semialdehyde dehydrogenase